MSQTTNDVSLVELIGRVVDGSDLGAQEAEAAFDVFMAGEASEIEMAGLLTALRAKGVTGSEVAGGVRALRKAMLPVAFSDPDALVDTAGTGGGSVTTFNISTAAALVAAGAGVNVAKHGNRSFTSRSGSADVLEALGVAIDLTPERMGEVLEEVGIVFMFAPLLHPAMRHVGPVRRGLGITTIMNILGPLTNPAGAQRQVIGVSDPDLLSLVSDALSQLGHTRALVVHGQPGLDELSPLADTDVAEISEDGVRRFTVSPGELGLDPTDPVSLSGGEPEDNARVIEQVLAGEEGGPRNAVVLNAAGAIWVAGLTDSLAAGIGMARESIDDGNARSMLERLREASNA